MLLSIRDHSLDHAEQLRCDMAMGNSMVTLKDLSPFVGSVSLGLFCHSWSCDTKQLSIYIPKDLCVVFSLSLKHCNGNTTCVAILWLL